MESIFPFGLPFATAFYLILYVLTFAIHHFLMHYFAAGSLYVAWGTLRHGFESEDSDETISAFDIIRDWMPFLLSAAITAGVAPLLFVQILYPQQFYTANLLLSWRWMVVIPVLIGVFYLLYLLKSHTMASWRLPIKMLVSLTVAIGFLFVGFCWTANHLISINEASWPEIYQVGNYVRDPQAIFLRTLIWLGGAFGSMAVIVSWQTKAIGKSLEQAEVKRLSCMVIAGLFIASIASVVYAITLESSIQEVLFGSAGIIYVVLASLGCILQVICWVMQLRNQTICTKWLMLSTLGCVVTLVSIATLREIIRWVSLQSELLFSTHQEASEISGFLVFLAFAVINFGLMAYCVRVVLQGLKNGPPTETEGNG